MSIIDSIVSALRSLTGGGAEESTTASGSTGPQSEGQVSVEHEPDTSTEAAVKGGSADSDGTDDAAAAGTDAAASTGTLVDEEAGREPAETVGEAGGVDVDRTVEEGGGGDDGDAESDAPGAGDAEDAAPGEDDTDEVGDDGGSDDGSTAADEPEAADDSEDADAEAAGSEGSTESVETITGIGPAYGSRLEEFGIGTVGELAAADPAEVAAGIDVSESRVSNWVERANDAA